MSDTKVTLDFEDAQRIFDLAVGADSACSGYMDSEDVVAMRKLAVAIGVDPAICTGEEFVTRFPHPYKTGSPDMDEYRRPVAVYVGAQWDTRPETDEETIARLGYTPGAACEAGRWRGRCGKLENDPIHQAESGSVA